uniref:Secreted protein n=1 Tax=Ixodes ricinus TaxID=34613 RepID=A0A6B0UE22_IXORI
MLMSLTQEQTFHRFLFCFLFYISALKSNVAAHVLGSAAAYTYTCKRDSLCAALVRDVPVPGNLLEHDNGEERGASKSGDSESCTISIYICGIFFIYY